MSNLKDNLYTKIKLKFNQDGKFKILMLSDIQETIDYDKRTLDAMNRIIEYTKPDLVVWGGDNCDGRVLKTEEEKDRIYVGEILDSKMLARNHSV